MTTRQYSSRSQQTTLTGAITSGATSMTVVSGTALLGGVTIPAGRTFTVVIDPDTALEEIVDVTAVSTNTFTITRAIDGSTAQEHSAGAAVRHMGIGRDYRDANLHAEADASYNDGGGNAHSMHGIAAGEGVVVGTLKAQTLTNKTLTSPTISNPTFTGTPSAEASIIFEGSTADAHETTLTVVDPTQDNTITLPNTTGTVVLATASQTLTNKTLGGNLDAGGYTVTNLAIPVNASDAVRKDFADAQVAAAATSAASAATSATSAATSAASASTSASSALTSANSASTSAASALTSANSAATSASTMAASVAAAATSAASASASATAAATSATSAAASATAAATSATSAAASATAAATSATSAAASATTSSNSASAAATSATSAAASATAAATSASSASTSASSALTSANSAATSATSAATSYDQFDDRYLGDKTSDPTLDNDGNPLLTGALYYNTAISAMKVYSGTVWQLVAPDTSNFVDKTAWTGKGAIVSATAASTPSALTVASTNGYVLAVNSATSTGLEWIAPNPGDITGVTAGTGLSGGGASGDVTLNLANTAVTPGAYTYTSLTVDAQGRLTAASNGTAPVTSVSGTATRITSSGGATPAIDLATTAVTPGSYTYSNFTVDAYGRLTAASNGSTAAFALTSGNLSQFAATTSAQLAGVISDETGSGALVFGTSPLITPAGGAVATAASQAGYMGIVVTAVTASGTHTRTFGADDAGKNIYVTGTPTSSTLTIPANGTTAFQVGTTIVVTNDLGAATNISIAITTDTLQLAGTGTTGTRTLARYGMATLTKVTSTKWIISGNGLT